MIIQHNLIAQVGVGNSKSTEKMKNKWMERLSSGYRINRAADDAAGLSISEEMRAQIRGLKRSSMNISDGMSYVQVADGALSQASSLLNRMRELSVQAANDTYTDDDRANIDDEIQQLKEESNRIFGETEFNTIKIWDKNKVTARQIGTTMEKVLTTGSAGGSVTINNTNRGAMPKTSFTLSATADDGITVSWTGYNGNTYQTSNISWPVPPTSSNSFNIASYLDTATYPELDGIDFTISYDTNDYDTMDDLVNALDGTRYGVTISQNTKITLSDNTGSDGISGLTSSVSLDYIATLASDRDYESSDTSFAIPSGSVTSNLTTSPDYTSETGNWEFSFTFDGIGEVKATSKSMSYASSDLSDDKEGIWWDYVRLHDGTRIKSTHTLTPTTNDGSIESLISCLDNTEGDGILTDSSSGGYITISFDLNSTSAYTYGDTTTSDVGSMTIKVAVSNTDTVDTIKSKLASIAGADIYEGSSNSDTDSVSSGSMRVSNPTVRDEIEVPVIAYDGPIQINIQEGANSGQVLQISYKYLDNREIGISDIDVTTREHASDSITTIDTAMKIVNLQRATLGASENRMEHGKAVNDSTAENLQSAESLIRDNDMSEATLENSKLSILEQAQYSIIANANASQQRILELLEQ